MEVVAIPRKIGGSLVVTLPNGLVKAEGIEEGIPIDIIVKKNKIDGFGMFKGIGLFTKEDKFRGQLEEDEDSD